MNFTKEIIIFGLMDCYGYSESDFNDMDKEDIIKEYQDELNKIKNYF